VKEKEKTTMMWQRTYVATMPDWPSDHAANGGMLDHSLSKTQLFWWTGVGW
jgi:uncharacterized protein (DUF2236 family)